MSDTGYMAEGMGEMMVGDTRRLARGYRVVRYRQHHLGDKTWQIAEWERREEYVPTNSISAEYAREGDDG